METNIIKMHVHENLWWEYIWDTLLIFSINRMNVAVSNFALRKRLALSYCFFFPTFLVWVSTPTSVCMLLLPLDRYTVHLLSLFFHKSSFTLLIPTRGEVILGTTFPVLIRIISITVSCTECFKIIGTYCIKF